jgi:hypothetical protein
MKMCGCVVSAVCCVLLGLSAAAQTGKDKPYLGKLPKGWSKAIGKTLSADQKAKLLEIDRKAKVEVDALLKKVADLRAKARQDQLAVLSKQQRKALAEALLGKVDEPDEKGKKDKDERK